MGGRLKVEAFDRRLWGSLTWMFATAFRTVFLFSVYLVQYIA